MLSQENIFNQLVRTSSIISSTFSIKRLISIMVEQLKDVTASDLAVLYLFTDKNIKKDYQRGNYIIYKEFGQRNQLVSFIKDINEVIICNDIDKSEFFKDSRLHEKMNSSAILPLIIKDRKIGFLILNSTKKNFYNKYRFIFIDAFGKIAKGSLQNAKLFKELKDYVNQIEELERYQKSIFSSMTNILVALDQKGMIKYFNKKAEKTLHINEACIGKSYKDFFKDKVSKNVLSAMDNDKKILGLEGIYSSEKEIDFSLNITPLTNLKGKDNGKVLVFTDQTEERDLKNRVNMVTEERRVIKDMFSRYLSTEVVNNLISQPDVINLGGDKKFATVLFADIRGYTSFSEGKDPEYMINILNEFFGEAVELILKNKGFIDKFIGDCIMAAWGVPLETEKYDAIMAIQSALDLQKLVNSEKRNFFKGDAKHLKIGIGIHSGPIVAGNIGSKKRINYTVIGDTVNVASRMEGVAGPEDIIITENTYELVKEKFDFKKQKPVKVKGKDRPIDIYKVIG